METPTKVCIRCKKSKPLTEFTKKKRAKDGLDWWCRECNKIYKKKWYQDNQETAIATSRQWRSDNKELKSQLAAEYYQRNKEARIAYSRKWRKDNPEYVKNRNATYPKTERGRKIVNLIIQRRVARKRELPDTLTLEQWEFALNYFGYCCAACGRPQTEDYLLAQDHWIPIASPNCPGTVVTNIVPLCHRKGGCNANKQDKPPRDWLLSRFGPDKATAILLRIEQYFEIVSQKP